MNKKTLRKIKNKTPRIFIMIVTSIIGLKKYWSIFRYIKNFFVFSKLSKKDPRFKEPTFKDAYPILGEDTEGTDFDRHYIYHPAWAARIIAQNKPSLHTDVSSILSFCTIVSAFVPVDFYDYRPADLKLENLNSKHADLMSLPFEDNTIPSLSCMHVIEHIGLGRYGDKIDPLADVKAMNELKRVLALDGDLLFVTPIGKPKILFNAHRVYGYDMIISQFSDLKLMEFSLIPRKSDGGLIKNPERSLIDSQDYGCGCFWFKKIR
ncbi:MAG: DUF268 domain-containing protein [bacterium]